MFGMGISIGNLDAAADLLLIKMRRMSVRFFSCPHRSAFTNSTAALELVCVLFQVQWKAPL